VKQEPHSGCGERTPSCTRQGSICTDHGSIPVSPPDRGARRVSRTGPGTCSPGRCRQGKFARPMRGGLTAESEGSARERDRGMKEVREYGRSVRQMLPVPRGIQITLRASRATRSRRGSTEAGARTNCPNKKICTEESPQKGYARIARPPFGRPGVGHTCCATPQKVDAEGHTLCRPHRSTFRAAGSGAKDIQAALGCLAGRCLDIHV